MNRPYYENTHKKVFTTHRFEAYSFESHFHSFIEIAFCFSGIQQTKIGGNIVTLTAGDAAVIFPNTVHEYISCVESDCLPTESVSVMCNLGFLSETFPEITASLPESPYIPAKDISPNVALAFREILNTSSAAEQIGWAYILLSGLLGKLSYKSVKNFTDVELPALITSYILDNYAEPLSIKHIAKKFGYSPSYIAHLFCNQLKIPFKTYLNSVRCDFAEKQLRTTKKSITEIAHLSGYNSLNTFCRCFKNHTGQTPSKFKKSMID